MYKHIPHEEGTIPPIGYILVKKEGKLYWADPNKIKLNPKYTSELTEQQVERVKRYKEILGEQDSCSLEEAIDNFRHDKYPEHEIQIWERIASVCETELERRPHASAEERGMVFTAVLFCSMLPNIGAILSSCPDLKKLRDLDRLVLEYRKR